MQISVLDLGPVKQGQEIPDALTDLVTHARYLESLGYYRIWIAEHHNFPGVSTAATAVLIGHLAGKTSRIRVGAGGIMLPNHSPLAIAEQFGTLDILYPGRIDLGLGRAPGTDQQTAAALRRNYLASQEEFPSDVQRLQQYFSNTNTGAKVRAFPGEGRNLPIWILGSSTDSAYLAAKMGLPYAFASHFAPTQLKVASAIYHDRFNPSTTLSKPYFMAGANVFVADTIEEAKHLRSSLDLMWLGIITGNRSDRLQAPVSPLPAIFSAPEVKHALQAMISCTFCGDKISIAKDLHQFAEQVRADELFVTNYIYDETARLHSFKLLSEAMELPAVVGAERQQ